MDSRSIEIRKASYRRWQEQVRNGETMQTLPLVYLKWRQVTEEPNYYLLELYTVVDALTEQCARLEAQMTRYEDIVAQVEEWQHREWLRATWRWRLKMWFALLWWRLVTAMERRGLAMMGDKS